MVRIPSKSMVLTVMTVLMSSSSAQANPVLWLPGSSPPEFLGLLSESLVIAFLLSRFGFHARRVFPLWYGVTLLTYWLGIFALAFLPSKTVTSQVLTVVVLEAAIVLFEARIILLIARARTFRSPEGSFGTKDALKVSLVGNMTSILVAVAVGALMGAL